MDNDKTDASSTTSTASVARGAGSSNRGAIAVAVLMFLLGGVVGLLGGLLLGDDGDASEAASTIEASVDCAEAEALVEGSATVMAAINESEVQDLGFFAALLVEQRKVVFAMEAAPSCFSLDDRADAQGLLEGIVILAQSSDQLPAQEAPVVDDGE